MAEKLTNREKLQIKPVPMTSQDPLVRRQNINEVPLGYTEQEAMAEAVRCLFCKNPPCMKGCPVSVDIPGFIALVAEGKFHEAALRIKQTNILPAVCGRVCPQEEQCEAHCMVAKSHKSTDMSVKIGRLERFVADWDRKHNPVHKPVEVKKTGKRVAVVGAGPAGLTVAGDLALLGHQVTIYEALHRAGGVLVYGIPEFRLPKEIVDYEVDGLRALGVEIKFNVAIGKSKSIADLFDEGYDAVFVGTGAGLPMFKKIPGENYLGVYSANEYLTRANLMNAYGFPHESDTPILRGRNVVTFGGGNVAMDSARTALRLGAETSTILYRRSEAEMPARIEEIHHAKEEGIEFRLLQDAIEILGDEEGWVTGCKCLKMELGEPDASGRRRPVPIQGSEFVIPADVVVVAIGNGPNPIVTQTTPELSTNKWGNIVADPETAKTTMRGVWAGGDIVLGAATVILAMGEGRRAAQSIHEYLTTGVW
ncbi:MAG TPA: NADPH-dependent glutamate synthase [Myxococcota bacterium]|nr:NADPH-dependent glutamate synthase [Myxococcota bacterium]HON24339.1 NADPH-dependent glutamate synthase [Myxococcota bacterium]HPL25165.1 NADPH-dependent glutamate synthase [Myxococcota bacterium]HQL56146.1 NADPH-dependent glutamate synthase [Myxococcota bacterium]